MIGKRRVATIVAEFLGTGILTLLVLSVQHSSIGIAFFVALIAGLTVTVMTFAFGNVSGAHFNPALTIALWTAKKISLINAVLYVGAQFLGAWTAYYLFTYLIHNSLPASGGHFEGRILVAEVLGTGIFAIGWAAAIYQGFSRAVSSSLAGIGYVVGIIAASSASIGLANPALALGVRAWVLGTYVIGPVIGALIGVNLYSLLFATPESLVASNVTPLPVEKELITLPSQVVVASSSTTKLPSTTTRVKSTKSRSKTVTPLASKTKTTTNKKAASRRKPARSRA